MSDKIMLKLFRNLKKFIESKNNKDEFIEPKNNKDEFISDNNIYKIQRYFTYADYSNIYKIQRYFAMADYSYEDIVIFVNDKTLKSIKKDMIYNVKAIDLSKNTVIFSDDVTFSIEKIDEIETLI